LSILNKKATWESSYKEMEYRDISS